MESDKITLNYIKTSNNHEKAQKNPEQSKVKVAVRVRPILQKENIQGNIKCTKCFPENSQILIGKDKYFTFDKVFDEYTEQEDVYNQCAKDLVYSCLDGYNATILAYGQTGSGKTFTMGSSNLYQLTEEQYGIIPRVIKQIFEEIQSRSDESEFLVKVSFLEIYNEDIHDLLDTTITSRIKSVKQQNSVTIREEKDGSINLYGLTEEKVSCIEEMMGCLERGSLQRATASTLMNESSSRSHAIFTINIEQHEIADLKNNEKKVQMEVDQEVSGFMTAKFHFVDLAGSERIKKTGATGNTLKEGININKGLLCLGNVISALTETSTKLSHVPYRESKLTRILQDSLGGNSQTYMIACVSPVESNFEESLNAIKYASRARNIKNKPIINRDPHSAQITQLKQQIFELQNEMSTYKKAMTLANIKIEDFVGKIPSSTYASPSRNLDNSSLEELKGLKIKVAQYEKQVNLLNNELIQTNKQLNEAEIGLYQAQRQRDMIRMNYEKTKQLLEEHQIGFQEENSDEIPQTNLVEEYAQLIEKQKNELNDQYKINRDIQIEYENLLQISTKDNQLLHEKTNEIQQLKRLLKKQEIQLKELQYNYYITPITNKNQQKNEIDQNIQESQQQQKQEQVEQEQEQEQEEDYDDDNYIDDDEDELQDEDQITEEFKVANRLCEKELLMVDGTLNEKQKLLQSITENQVILEKSLLKEMKQQYYSKIQQLESEIKNIEKQRDKALGKVNNNDAGSNSEKNKIIGTYKQKVMDLETQLKEFKKKERDQINIGKLAQNQQSKLQALDEEIKKMKQQKIGLMKKMREDSEKFEKWKQDRQKELIQAKKKNLQKDAEITKLKYLNKRSQLILKKKQEELKSKIRLYEIFKYVSPVQKYKKKKTQNLNSSKLGGILEDYNPNNKSLNTTFDVSFTEEQAENLLDYFLAKLQEYVEIENQLEKEEEELEKAENELEIEMKKLADNILTKEKLQMNLQNNSSLIEVEADPETSSKLQSIELEINELTSRIESIEESIEFKTQRISDITQTMKESSIQTTEKQLFNNEKTKNDLFFYSSLFKLLMARYIGLFIEHHKLNAKNSVFLTDINELNNKIEELQARLRVAEYQYEMNLTKLTQEYEEKNLMLLRQHSAYDTTDIEDEVLIQNIYNNMPKNDLRDQSPIHNNNNNNNNKNQFSKVNDYIKLSPKPVNRSKENLHVTGIKKNKGNEDATKKTQTNDKLIIDEIKKKCDNLQTKYDSLKNQQTKGKSNNMHQKQLNENPNETQIQLQSQSVIFGNNNNNTDSKSILSASQILSDTNYNNKSFQSLSASNSGIFTKGLPKSSNPYGIASQQYQTNAIDTKQTQQISKFGQVTHKHHNSGMLSLRDRRKEEKAKKSTREESPIEAKVKMISDELAALKKPTTNTNTNLPSTITKNKGALNLTPVPASKQLNPSVAKSTFHQTKMSYGRLSGTSPPPKDNKMDPIATVHTGLLSNKDGLSEFFQVDQKPNLEEQINPESKDNQIKLNFDNENDNNLQFTEKTDPQELIYESQIEESQPYDNNIWKCVMTIEAHNSPIYCVASIGNMLYSSTNKNFKIWSLDTMQMISNITAHSAAIKCMAIWAEKNLVVTACDKVISLWDLVSLQNIATLKGHKDEIRSLHVDNGILYSAGKGGPTYGSILTWDLRSINPVHEKEKNQDVFSLKCNQNILYYGTGDHKVRRMNLEDLQILSPFEPPHYDTVTSLTILKDQLISGSRDKSMRIWSLGNNFNNLQNTCNTHYDYVNTLESNENMNTIYSGSRDGRIKIWNVRNSNKLQCISDLNEHTQSVNCITNLQDNFENMFVSASSDKTIKIWRPSEESYYQFINDQENQKYNEIPQQIYNQVEHTQNQVFPINTNSIEIEGDHYE